MRNCIDEGTLQAWFDGELAANAAAEVAAHLHGCTQCAKVARTIESESLILSQGLAAEFADAIPTERLRQRVDEAIAQLPAPIAPTTGQSWSRVFRNLMPSFRVLAYATAIAAMLLVGFFIVSNLRKERSTTQQANQRTTPSGPANVESSPAPKPEQIVQNPESPEIRRPKAKAKPRTVEPDAMSLSWQERQYERAIAKLNEAIKTQPPMGPSLLVEYEYNLALINNAIASTRDVARKNPGDPHAAQFMQAAYQSKIDLMNQIAEARVLER